MNESWILIALLALAAPMLLLGKKWFGKTKSQRDKSLTRLEEVIRSAELTNGAFFRSLELVQKNLELLVARAESAEQRLRGVMVQPEMGRKDPYTTAAVLLSERKAPEQVAAMLKLPLAQVQMVQELQTVMGKGESVAPQKKREKERGPSAIEAVPKSKSSASKEKSATRAHLLKNLLVTRDKRARGRDKRSFVF